MSADPIERADVIRQEIRPRLRAETPEASDRERCAEAKLIFFSRYLDERDAELIEVWRREGQSEGQIAQNIELLKAVGLW